MEQDQHAAIRMNQVSFRYDHRNVLENISLTVNKGAFLGLVGPNGSGKSTLIKLLLGLLPIQKGQIELFGKKVSKFRDWDKVGFVSQKANSFNSGFPATVFEVVSMAYTGRLGCFVFLRRCINNKFKRQLS